MIIPDPKASHGDDVLVENYRTKDHRQEPGRVVGLSYANQFGGGFRWQYEVHLDRRGGGGRPIRLYVGDDAISRAAPRGRR